MNDNVNDRIAGLVGPRGCGRGGTCFAAMTGCGARLRNFNFRRAQRKNMLEFECGNTP